MFIQKPLKMWSQQEMSDFSEFISALANYRSAVIMQLDRLQESGIRAPNEIMSLKDGVNNNADLFEYVLKKAPYIFGGDKGIQLPIIRTPEEFDESDLSQLMAAVKSAARDWTSLGNLEREQTYKPIINALKEYLPSGSNVLIPGAGLCRLAVEIASNGFTAYANEQAFVMLIMSQIALRRKKTFQIFPFLHQISGLDSLDGALIHATFPEAKIKLNDDLDDNGIIEPLELLNEHRLNLLAGGFEAIQYARTQVYDSVATCYFIDVVADIPKAINLIYNILRPGGYWINFGPMLLHRCEDSFFSTMTLNDLKKVAIETGFQVIKEERVETTYIENPKSHLKSSYNCQFLVLQK